MSSTTPEAIPPVNPVEQPKAPSRRLKMGVAGVSISLFALLGCPGGSSAPEGEGPNTVVDGDSQTFSSNEGPGLAKDKIPQRFLVDEMIASGKRISVSAFLGRTTVDLDTRTWPAELSPIDITVTALGTNDGNINTDTGELNVPMSQFPAFEPDTYLTEDGELSPEATTHTSAYLERMQAKCDVLVGVNTHAANWPSLATTGPIINNSHSSLLQTRAALGRGEGVYVDWDSFAVQNPGWFREESRDVHFEGLTGTEPGYSAYRRVLVTGADVCEGLINDPTPNQYIEITPDNIDALALQHSP